MTEQRNPQDHARELANGIIDGVMASVDRNGELDPGCRNDAVDTVMKLIAAHTASQLAGAVREKIAKWRVSALNYSKSIGSISVALAREINALADELESLVEKRRGE